MMEQPRQRRIGQKKKQILDAYTKRMMEQQKQKQRQRQMQMQMKKELLDAYTKRMMEQQKQKQIAWKKKQILDACT